MTEKRTPDALRPEDAPEPPDPKVQSRFTHDLDQFFGELQEHFRGDPDHLHRKVRAADERAKRTASAGVPLDLSRAEAIAAQFVLTQITLLADMRRAGYTC